MYIGIDLVMSQKTEEQVGHYQFDGIERVGRYTLEGEESLLGDILIYSGDEESVLDTVQKLEEMNVTYLAGEDVADIIVEYADEYDS